MGWEEEGFRMRKWPDDFINKIICGDCMEIMKEIPKNSIDAIVTDPPYGLEFMGKEWDRLEGTIGEIKNKNMRLPSNLGNKRNVKCPDCGKWIYDHHPRECQCGGVYRLKQRKMQLWHTQWLKEAFRVLKPGASMLAMGGTRTFHRLMVAIEDSGFIIKDTLMWLYGSGFPKAQDLTNMLKKRGIETDKWQGYKIGGIKPAYEPIVWAVKPPEGSYIDNVLKWGVGAVNVDECRIGFKQTDNIITKNPHTRTKGTDAYQTHCYGKYNPKEDFIDYTKSKGRFPANVILDEEAGRLLDEQSNASRFFYCAKASRAERNAGLEDLKEKSKHYRWNKAGRWTNDTSPTKNHHPTVKPIKLFEWLIKLITREEQIVLDPFIGSGTTAIASFRVGRKYIGIEREKEYIKIAEERLAQGILKNDEAE